MLLSIQFPIAELRYFAPMPPHTLLKFPPRTGVDPDFVRGFGPATERRRGAYSAWPDEFFFYQANRAISLVELGRRRLGKPSIGPGKRIEPRVGKSFCYQGRNNLIPTGAFRRLLSDGGAVVRVEVGIRNPRRGRQPYSIDGLHLQSIVQDFLALRTTVSRIGWNNTGPLYRQGSNLAWSYRYATRPHIEPGGTEFRRRVFPESGRPFVLVEHGTTNGIGFRSFKRRAYDREAEVESLPEGTITIHQSDVGGASLGFYKVPMAKDIRIDTWFLGKGDGSIENLRNLRLCLLRLHAERQVLALVLREFSSGGLKFQPGTEQGDRLEYYLNQTIRSLRRPRQYGISHTALVEAFDAAEATANPGEMDYLKDRFYGMRRQVWKKVEEYQEARRIGFSRPLRNITIQGGVTVQNKPQQFFQGGTYNAPIVNQQYAETIYTSIKNLVDSDKGQDNEELQEAAMALLRETTNLVSMMQERQVGDTEEIARRVEILTSEASRPKPLRDVVISNAERLIEASKSIAEAAGPIAKAINTFLRVLGMSAS